MVNYIWLAAALLMLLVIEYFCWLPGRQVAVWRRPFVRWLTRSEPRNKAARRKAIRRVEQWSRFIAYGLLTLLCLETFYRFDWPILWPLLLLPLAFANEMWQAARGKRWSLRHVAFDLLGIAIGSLVFGIELFLTRFI